MLVRTLTQNSSPRSFATWFTIEVHISYTMSSGEDRITCSLQNIAKRAIQSLACDVGDKSMRTACMRACNIQLGREVRMEPHELPSCMFSLVLMLKDTPEFHIDIT